MEEKEKEIEVFKAPPDVNKLMKPKKRKVKVLEEDEYVDKVERIIERDFFPELDKLKARSDYIDATDRNDTKEMLRLRERYSTSRLTRLETPSSHFETPQMKSKEDESKSSTSSTAAAPDPKGDKDELTGVSLDKFLSKHTSEDNESFYELMEEQREEFERTHQWMFKKDEQLSLELQNDSLKLPSIEEQCSERPKETKALDGWTYKNENAVFYHPAGTPLSNAEKMSMAAKQKIINRQNTRFKSNPWKMNEKKGQTALIAAKKEIEAGKVGIDGKDLLDSSSTTPSVNGYKLLRMDNPTPQFSASESPFMTWGQVESTPYRLEGADEDSLPVNVSAGGPQFKIQDVPKRDRLAFELAEKNSRFYRDKKNKAIEKARSHLKTPKSAAGNLTTRVATMSPAAQRLATAKLGIRIGTDKALKAAYTPTPKRSGRRPSSSVSLGISTPLASSAASLSKINASPSLSLTDNLLNLPSSSSSKRSKASDFL